MSTATPPTVYGPPPDGFRWVARPEGKIWRLQAGKQCRWMEGGPRSPTRCPEQAVAALNRGRRVYGKGVADSWWAYCADHLYGRWIEDGVLMFWAVAAVDPEVVR